MKSSKRKTRSDKFPLTLHPTGQYCKKIKGRIRYFGTDKKQALERYLGRLAGYADTNDAERLCVDPAMRHVCRR